MPAKDKAILSVSMTNEGKERVTTGIKRYNAVLSKVLLSLMDKIEGGEIAIVENEIVVQAEKGIETPHQRKFNKFLDRLRDKGYPDDVIDSYLDSMVEQVSEMMKYKRRGDIAC